MQINVKNKTSITRLDLGILFGAFLIRIIYSVWMHPIHEHAYSDAGNYIAIANRIVEGQWLEGDFFQPIGLPLLIAGFKSIWGSYWSSALAILHSFVSTLTIALLFAVSRQVFSPLQSRSILILSSLHLPWILFTGFAMAETLFTFFLGLLLWAQFQLQKSNHARTADAILWGVSFAFCSLLKGTHILLFPCTLAFSMAFKRPVLKKFFVGAGIAITLGFLSSGLLALNTVRHFKPMGSAAAVNLIEGKCPQKWNVDSEGHEWLSPAYAQQGHDTTTSRKVWPEPFSNSRYFFKEAFDCVRRNPLILIQSIEAIPMLFIGNVTWPTNQSPHADWIRLHEFFYVIFSLVGVCVFGAFVWINRKNPAALRLFELWGLPIASLFLTVYVFKSEARLRVPFDLFLIPVSVWAWSTLVQKIRG